MKTKENLNRQKLRQFINQETHYEVEKIEPREDAVFITAIVEHGLDPDRMEEEYGVIDLNRGTLKGEYESLDPTFFQDGEYNGEI